MSLMQEQQDLINKLSNEFADLNMREKLDRYCNRIINTEDRDKIASDFVLSSDKDIPVFNEGHILSAILYGDEKYFNQFINWYKNNYITKDDVTDTYDTIDDCIKKNFDSRMSTYISCLLLDNGLNSFKDIDEVREVMDSIDKRHDQYEKDGALSLTSRSFDKSVTKTCYKIAKQFTPIEVLEYISRNLVFTYDKNVSTNIYYYDKENKDDLSITLNANNNIDMISALTNILNRIYYEYSFEVDPDTAKDTLIDAIVSEDYITDYSDELDRLEINESNDVDELTLNDDDNNNIKTK